MPTVLLEWSRRLCLLAGLLLAVVWANWAYHGPYVFLSLHDEKPERAEPARSPDSLLPQGRQERRMEAQAVDGEEWNALFTQVRRFGGRLLLRPEALPAQARDAGELAVRLGGEGERLELTAMTGRSALLGTGLAYTEAERVFFYPLRAKALWWLPAGLAVYLLLPWPRRPKASVHHPRWRIVLMDFAVIGLLVAPFLSLPLFIVGSATAALTEYWLFSAVFWLVAAIGATLFPTMVRQAVTRIDIQSQGLRWLDAGGWTDIPFAELARVERVRIEPPVWLRRLMWVAALFARGAGRLRAVGQAALLSTQHALGLRLRTASGKVLYLWHTDSQGGVSVTNLTQLERALAKGGVDITEADGVLRGVFLPH